MRTASKALNVQIGIATDPCMRAENEDFTACAAAQPLDRQIHRNTSRRPLGLVHRDAVPRRRKAGAAPAAPPRISRTEGLAIAGKLAKGVAALHRAGVIHRDIKPDNVILQPDGGLKLIDLGVARLPNIEDVPASSIPGTPSYIAPELIEGQAGNVSGDVKTDLFALGVTLFRMFTGAYLWRGRGLFPPALQPPARSDCGSA